MAAGTYQPIVPYDLEAFRSGAPAFQESASLAAVYGAPVKLDSAGQIAEVGTTFLEAFGILAKTGSNAGSAGASIGVYPIRPDVIWEVTLNEAYAVNQIGKSYGLLKDATTKNWYLSTADIGNQMYIVAAHPATAVNDTKSRVLARFNPSAIQTWEHNQPNVGILAASGAISPNIAASYIITKATAAAMTLAAPTAGVDDGKIIRVYSNTAAAHTVTATGLLYTGAAATDVATFAAQKGAGLTLMAYGAKWQVLAALQITFT